ncbi:hypothetical protein Tco_0814861 [Tanacetum coccineum]
MTSTTKTKATQYDLPGIEEVLNIWSPVKVAYDRYALWGISHWREQITYVKVMRKHGYRYLEEIVVRRADNVLYRFKEGDDVADFAIVLRMFTRSLVIQKRAEDLQLGVKSYQKKINVTKPDTTRPDLKKGTRTLYTNTLKDSFMSTTTRGTVLAKENMEHIGKEKSSFHDQGHQQPAKGKEDDEEFREICWRFDTSAGNPINGILLKLNLPDHRSILKDSKMEVKRQSVKVKEIQERCIIKAFQDYQIKKGMSMSVQKSQVHEMAKFTRWQNEIMLG